MLGVAVVRARGNEGRLVRRSAGVGSKVEGQHDDGAHAEGGFFGFGHGGEGGFVGWGAADGDAVAREDVDEVDAGAGGVEAGLADGGAVAEADEGGV